MRQTDVMIWCNCLCESQVSWYQFAIADVRRHSKSPGTRAPTRTQSPDRFTPCVHHSRRDECRDVANLRLPRSCPRHRAAAGGPVTGTVWLRGWSSRCASGTAALLWLPGWRWLWLSTSDVWPLLRSAQGASTSQYVGVAAARFRRVAHVIGAWAIRQHQLAVHPSRKPGVVEWEANDCQSFDSVKYHPKHLASDCDIFSYRVQFTMHLIFFYSLHLHQQWMTQ